MSWLRSTSLSFARQLSRSLDPRHDYEPHACYNSFCKHWQQAHDIILKSQVHEVLLKICIDVHKFENEYVFCAVPSHLQPKNHKYVAAV